MKHVLDRYRCAIYMTVFVLIGLLFSASPCLALNPPVLQYPPDGEITGGHHVEFKWAGVTGATTYDLEISEDPTFATVAYSGDTWGWTIRGLNFFQDDGTLWYWRVRAVDATGAGPWTNASFINGYTTACTASPGIGIGVLGNNQPDVDTCFESGTGLFRLYDISRRAGQTGHTHDGQMNADAAIYTESYSDGLLTDVNNLWDATVQASGVDAHVYTGVVYDFQLEVLNRNSYDDTGISMKNFVESNFTSSGGSCWNNAFWNGAYVTVCISSFYPSFAGALDVIAHEWGHSITGNESGLDYQKESGALNEAFSDWMGASVENWNGEVNWTIGEGVRTIRDLSDPLLYAQPDTYLDTSRQWRDLSSCTPGSGNDMCWVHTNSGVPNKMFFLLADGGTHPVTGVTVQGLGTDVAFQIAYLANANKWTHTTGFEDALLGMVSAAEDEYGVDSNEVFQVLNAWAAVGVGQIPEITATAVPAPGGGVGGTITPSGTFSVEYGTDVSFTIAPEPGYEIADVRVNGIFIGPVSTYTFNDVRGDYTIEAFFTPQASPGANSLLVNVNGAGTVTSSPAGINCGTDCYEAYSQGTSVTLTATAAPGNVFTGWSGGTCIGTGTCIVTLNTNKVVEALFEDLGTQLDLVFVIDSTGSMWDDIDHVKASAIEIVNSIDFGVSDFRVAVVDYKDHPVAPYGGAKDYPYRAVHGFTSNKSAIVDALNSLSASGGADKNEAVFSALIRTASAEDLGAWRATAKKAIILMGDAPPHDPEPITGYTLTDTINAVNGIDSVISHLITSLGAASDAPGPDSGAAIYSILIGSDDSARSYFKALAHETGGELFEAPTANDVVGAILDAVIKITNRPPVCGYAVATTTMLWSPNHEMVPIKIRNIVDPDGDPMKITITQITQDEPVRGAGSGSTSPDGNGVGSDVAWVRAERSGKADGRVYEIHFTASDGKDGSCSGSVMVCVPHDQGENTVCKKGNTAFNSTLEDSK